ncbi:MAG: hypothetical protein IE927_14245 [Rhodobacterales bacterium]|nr:hypothetical protein [Rhodobacterales bacterium]
MLRAWPLARGRAAAMGALALAALLGMEAALAAALDTAPGAFLRSLATPAGALGLAGQAVFALFPALRAGRGPARG